MGVMTAATILQWTLAIVGILLATILVLAFWSAWHTNRVADKVLAVLTFEPKYVPHIREEAGVSTASIFVALGRLVEEGWAEQSWAPTRHPGTGMRSQYRRKRLGSRRRRSWGRAMRLGPAVGANGTP